MANRIKEGPASRSGPYRHQRGRADVHMPIRLKVAAARAAALAGRSLSDLVAEGLRSLPAVQAELSSLEAERFADESDD